MRSRFAAGAPLHHHRGHGSRRRPTKGTRHRGARRRGRRRRPTGARTTALHRRARWPRRTCGGSPGVPADGTGADLGHHRRSRRRKVDADQLAHRTPQRARSAGGGARHRSVFPVQRWRDPGRPGSDGRPRTRPSRLHPIDGDAGSPRRSGTRRARGGAGAGRCRLRLGAGRDRRGRTGRGRHRRAGGHDRGGGESRWGDAVQANKAGLMEIADVFVINKADRDGVRQTRHDLAP